MWYLALLAVLLAAVQVEVKMADGPPVTGALIEATAERVVVQADQRRELPAARIASVHVKAPSPETLLQPSMWVELADGSKLSGKSYTVAAGVAEVELAIGGRVRLPTRDIRSVRFAPLANNVLKSWQAATAPSTVADRLAVVKAAGAVDVLEGVLRDVTPEIVQFEIDGEMLRVKRPKVFGLVYQQVGERKLADAACVVETAADDKVAAASIKAAADRLTLTSRLGVQFDLPLAAIRKIDYASSKLTYLSELEPQRAVWTPFVGPGGDLAELARLYEPRRDRALLGGPLLVWQTDAEGRLARVRHEKGLSLHSRTEVVYRLAGGFRELVAQAGIDPRVRDGGHATLVVLGDEKRLFESPLVRAEAAKSVRVDLRGVNRLTILVDYGQDLDVGDYVNLGDARLMK
jgi:hypothetical protein